MRLTKIRNIDIKECSREQMYCYNIATFYGDLFIKRDKETRVKDIVQFVEKNYDSFNKPKNIDKETVLEIFKKNIERYFNLKYHLLTSYKQVGETFQV